MNPNKAPMPMPTPEQFVPAPPVVEAVNPNLAHGGKIQAMREFLGGQVSQRVEAISATATEMAPMVKGYFREVGAPLVKDVLVSAGKGAGILDFRGEVSPFGVFKTGANLLRTRGTALVDMAEGAAKKVQKDAKRNSIKASMRAPGQAKVANAVLKEAGQVYRANRTEQKQVAREQKARRAYEQQNQQTTPEELNSEFTLAA